MRRVVFLDHLDTGAAVLSDLVDVGTFHQAQADVRMPQTVGRTGSSFAVKAKILFVEDGFEKLALPLRKNKVSRSRRAPLFAKDSRGHGRFCGRVHAINARRAEPASKSLKGPHCTGHTLAISDAALSAHFNLQDRLAQILVVNDRDIPELKAPCLVGPQSGIDCKEHIVVKLFRFPFEALFFRLLRALSCRFVESSCIPLARTTPGGRFWGMTGTAQRNREAGRAIRGAAPFLGSGGASRFPDAWCYGLAACHVSLIASWCL